MSQNRDLGGEREKRHLQRRRDTPTESENQSESGGLRKN